LEKRRKVVEKGVVGQDDEGDKMVDEGSERKNEEEKKRKRER
jgi:hypothetical protein